MISRAIVNTDSYGNARILLQLSPLDFSHDLKMTYLSLVVIFSQQPFGAITATVVTNIMERKGVSLLWYGSQHFSLSLAEFQQAQGQRLIR